MNRTLTSLQQQILDYVRNSVNAAETARGVNHVWLNRTSNSQSIAEVEQALEGLVALGFLEKHLLPGGGAIYRMAHGARTPPRMD
jgi:Fe2+ or Zn2+ uptake regulation protein